MRNLLVLVAAIAVACSDGDGNISEGSLDGNVIVWDGSVSAEDAGATDGGHIDVDRDAGVGDADATRPDDGGVDPCRTSPSITVTATRAAADASLLGRVLEARGPLIPAPPECTGGPCSDEAPCCESCAAPLRLDGVLALSRSACRNALIGCSGSNCAMTCSPPVFGGEIGVVGRLVAGDDGVVLEVWELRP
jgi:hypothetical protein